MYRSDFAALRQLLERLAEVYGKALTDTLVASYWDALRDLPLAQVEELAKGHVKCGKFFPKPVDLRPKYEKPPLVRDDVAIREGEHVAAERLEELRVKDPGEWLRQVRPKVTELGLAKGMTLGEIEFKLHRYQREGA